MTTLNGLENKANKIFNLLKEDDDFSEIEKLRFVKSEECFSFEGWNGTREIFGNSCEDIESKNTIGYFDKDNDTLEVDDLIFFKCALDATTLIAVPAYFKHNLLKKDATQYFNGVDDFMDICDMCGSNFDDKTGDMICPNCRK